MKKLFLKYRLAQYAKSTVFPVFLVFTFTAHASEYYVATGGSDSNAGSIDSPLATIDTALTKAQSGDTITLRAGTYNAPFFPNEGAINIPNLTIQGYPGERPHIKSDYGSGKKITLYFGLDADNATLKNLEISGGDVYTVQTESNFDYVSANERDAATGLTIENCEIHHSGEDIIKISAGSDDAKIINSDIHHSCLLYTEGDANSQYPNCQGIDNVNSDRMLVQGNRIHDIPYDNPALFFKGGARDVVIERNLIENAYAGVWVGAQTDIDFYSPEDNPAPHYNSFNSIVRNNIIKNVRGECIAVMAAKDPKIYNNTLMNCGSEAEGLSISFRHQPTYINGTTANEPTINALVVNNLVTSNASGANPYGDHFIKIQGHHESADAGNIQGVANGGLMLDYNVYWDSRYSDLRARNSNQPWLPDNTGLTDYETLTEWQVSPLHNSAYADLHTQYGNPQINAEGNLLAGSPAIGTGVAVEGLTEDFYGNQRTGAIDIGAVVSNQTTPRQTPRTPPASGEKVYEDAEDGNTSGWRVYDNDPVDANVLNIYNDDKQSKVIELQGNGTENGYILGNWSTGDGAWSNTQQKIISWNMNYSESFYVFISLQTSNGHRYLYYTADDSDSDSGVSNDGEYIHHGLGSQSTDGAWHIFTRDLDADLKEFESENEVISVNAFLIRGSGLVDDIELKR